MIKVRKAALSAAVTGVMSATAFGFVLPVLTAHAYDNSQCAGTSNETCAFDGYDYQYGMGARYAGTAPQNISAAYNDKLSGWINFSSTGSRFHWDTNQGGNCVSMYAHNQATAHAGDGNPNNNRASSWAFNGTCN